MGSTRQQAAEPLLRGYSRNHRPAVIASWLVGVCAAVFAASLALTGLRSIALGVALASEGVNAYGSLWRSTYAWLEVLAAVGGFGALGMVAAGIAFLVWLYQSIENLRLLPVPDIRPRLKSFALTLILLFPVLAVAYFVVRTVFPDSGSYHFALYVAAAASLAGPYAVVRRLWASSSTRPYSGTAPPVSTSVMVWWVALGVTWFTLAFAPAVMAASWDYYQLFDEVTRLIAAGLVQMIATTATVVAAALIIRIMFGVNSLQDALAHRVTQSTSPVDERGAGPTRRSAVQWRCESCDFLNHPAARLCQNCAQEKR